MKRINLFLLMMVAALAGLRAQNVTTPYSMYGYGILSDRATSMQRQMGSVGYAMNSGRQINVMNPASYAAIDSLTFLFDMGADVTMLWQKEGNVKDNSTGGGLDYITMQFPITKYLGGSIGLLPYSSVGYAFGNEIKFGALENQGSGGINQAYFGLGGKIKGFSLGVNIAYSFGNIVNDVYATPTTSGQSLVEHVIHSRTLPHRPSHRGSYIHSQEVAPRQDMGSSSGADRLLLSRHGGLHEDERQLLYADVDRCRSVV